MISPIADFLLFILIRNTYLIEFTLIAKKSKDGAKGVLDHVSILPSIGFYNRKKSDCENIELDNECGE